MSNNNAAGTDLVRRLIAELDRAKLRIDALEKQIARIPFASGSIGEYLKSDGDGGVEWGP